VPTSTEPRYLRTAQVAELLHVSPKTVSRWAQEGRLRLLSLRQLPMATIFAARSTAQTADSRPRQRRGRHQTAEHACRWNLASGLDLRGRVTRATPPVVGQMGTNRDVAGALERGPPDLVNALAIQHRSHIERRCLLEDSLAPAPTPAPRGEADPVPRVRRWSAVCCGGHRPGRLGAASCEASARKRPAPRPLRG
jgi:hypothetical protein